MLHMYHMYSVREANSSKHTIGGTKHGMKTKSGGRSLVRLNCGARLLSLLL